MHEYIYVYCHTNVYATRGILKPVCVLHRLESVDFGEVEQLQEGGRQTRIDITTKKVKMKAISSLSLAPHMCMYNVSVRV